MSKVMDYFKEISKIPRGSMNEEGICNYIEDFAIQHKLKYYRDEMHNIIVYKPASKGYEKHDSVMLQAHTDMVCEKNNDCNHNFEEEPLDLIIEDDYIFANGTTLGADDGYGVAYMLSLLDDSKISHPALECVFTVQEETGLDGAFGLDMSQLSAKRYIGLDSDDEDATCITSAGGKNVWLKRDFTVESNGSPVYKLSIKGLLGGHSGAEIDQERGNANIIGIRMMKYLLDHACDVRLVDFTGGLKDNAIPREADIIFASSSNPDDLKQCISQYSQALQDEYRPSDAGLTITLEEAESDACISSYDSEAIITMLYLMPYGVISRSVEIDGLVNTSLNLGVVRTYDDYMQMTYSLRSAVDEKMDFLSQQVHTLASLFETAYEESHAYPSWPYQPNSSLRKSLKKEYKKSTKRTLQEVATHGGLETGIFRNNIPGLDIVTIGPAVFDIHTPNERMKISSFVEVYEFLVHFLGTL